MPRNKRSKRWCFTLNQPTQEENESLLHLIEQLNQNSSTGQNPLNMSYLIVGQETGESGTFHLQGYLELTQKSGLSKMKKFLKRAHWEIAKGTSQQASDYCKKDGNFQEAGQLAPGRGYRSDLQEIKEKIDNGATQEEIADQHFSKWVVYRKAFTAYAALKHTKRSWKTIVCVLWGKTGTGKTRFVHDQVMDSTLWSPGDYKWFDGYANQDIVLFDDYRGEYPLQMLLKLCDRYPMQVPIKGDFVNWAPKKIYITSNVNPAEWYKNDDPYSRAALFRRIECIHACFEDIYSNKTND